MTDSLISTPLVLTSLVLTALGVAVALGFVWRRLARFVPASLRSAVAGYVLVLGAMAATGLAAGVAGAGVRLTVGALLVAGSDLAVARQRFVAAAFANKLVGLPAYYLGQTLVALSLAPVAAAS